MAILRTFLAFSSLLLLGQEASGFNVYHLGGKDGTGWQAAISFAPGEYQVLGADGLQAGRGTLAAPSTFPSWEDTLNAVVDSVDGQWLRPYFLPSTLNLAQNGVRDRIKRGVSDNIVTSGTCYNNISQVNRARPMFDGDPTTAAFYSASPSEDPEVRAQFYVQNSIIDLGVNFPVNRVRFFPRLGKGNPKIDEILANMAEPRLAKEDLPEEDFADNFLRWFEVSGAHSLMNFAGNCYWSTQENPWFRIIPQGTLDAPTDSRLTTLRRDTENLDVVVDFRFPTQQLEWVAIRPINPIGNWEIAEFQVFGEGYVERAVYTTAVLDFGEPMAWGKIRWQGELEEGARMLIRTRSGSDSDPHLYWIPSNIAGELKPLTRQEYERADIVNRRITLDEENWSFWSAPYSFEAGRRDTTRPAAAWEDGTPILSPGPSRYLQLQIVFLPTLEKTGRLRELEIQFARPAALRVVGEIWPLDTSPEESATFTYSVRPTLDEVNEGFDRLEIFTLTRADTVRSVRVDGVEVLGQFPAQILEDRILVSLPLLQGRKDTFKLIEVLFDARVVRYGTEFQGWVFNSESAGVKQLIEAGDATVDFPGNALGVRTDHPGANLLGQVRVLPNPFTPNGDGINEQARFHFQLREVSTPRRLRIDLYDLSGRRVRALEERQVIRGLFGQQQDDLAWDGRNDQGEQVAAGLYLYRILLDIDEEKVEKTGAIAVAY